jgi:hypothetical protein
VKRLLLLLAIAFVLFWLLTAPEDAAQAVSDIADLLRRAAQSVVAFFNALSQ